MAKEECRECGAFPLPGEELNHFAQCSKHPTNIRLAEMEIDKHRQEPTQQYSGNVTAGGSGVVYTTKPAVQLKGSFEIKLNEEAAAHAFEYYLTNVMNMPNMNVTSVGRNAKKEFIIKFEGKEECTTT